MKRTSNTISRNIAGLIFIILNVSSAAIVLPPPGPENASYILPIASPNNATIIGQVHDQLGTGSLYNRRGVSFTYTPWPSDPLEGCLHKADSMSWHLGLILHHRPARAALGLEKFLQKTDLREFTWRLNGINWYGGKFQDQLLNDGRNGKIPTNSRLAPHARKCYDTLFLSWGIKARKGMDKHPGVIAAINYVVEKEMPTGGEKTDSLLGDYSPYAITEFRDWLRHRGIYDPDTGKYKADRAPSEITGVWLQIGKSVRSQFYDDPTPANNNGTGKSFNETFGTTFTTWKLRYWDLEAYPAPITDTTFDVSPESGTGFVANGFDAPRERIAASAWWKAWSWDVLDQGGAQPAGFPEKPAYGFRQMLIAHFLDDAESQLLAAGLPRNLLFRHQIPGEVVSAGRLRAGATPIWTGVSKDRSTLGITRFGKIDPALMTRYLDTTKHQDAGWGIFEWHPLPRTDHGYMDSAARYSPQLLKATVDHLTLYHKSRVRVLFPGWWSNSGNRDDINYSVFALPSSNFAEGIRIWRDTAQDVPFNAPGATMNDYVTPAPRNLKGIKTVSGDSVTVSWSPFPWDGFHARFTDWRGFETYRVEWSNDGTVWAGVSTKDTMVRIPKCAQYRVCGVNKAKANGFWAQGYLTEKELEWHFTSNNEGWIAAHSLTSEVKDGKLCLSVNGTDPYIVSADNLNIDCNESKYVYVNARNLATGTTVYCYWAAQPSPNFSGALAKGFSGVVNDSLFRTYMFDFSGVAEWKGVLRKFRIDPTGSGTGNFDIDFVKISDKKWQPYKGKIHAIPCRIEAEEYDEGGRYIGYFDSDSVNTGNVLRQDGVDIQACSDAGGGYNVTSTKKGEQLTYTCQVTKANEYMITLRVASANGGKMAVFIDGTRAGGSITVPSTGGVAVWSDLVIKGIKLTEGTKKVTVVWESDDINLNYLDIAGPLGINVLNVAAMQYFVNQKGAVIDFNVPDDCEINVFTIRGQIAKTRFSAGRNQFDIRSVIKSHGHYFVKFTSREFNKMFRVAFND
jgi:hypothetical protein